MDGEKEFHLISVSTFLWYFGYNIFFHFFFSLIICLQNKMHTQTSNPENIKGFHLMRIKIGLWSGGIKVCGPIHTKKIYWKFISSA